MVAVICGEPVEVVTMSYFSDEMPLALPRRSFMLEPDEVEVAAVVDVLVAVVVVAAAVVVVLDVVEVNVVVVAAAVELVSAVVVDALEVVAGVVAVVVVALVVVEVAEVALAPPHPDIINAVITSKTNMLSTDVFLFIWPPFWLKISLKPVRGG